MDFEPKIMEIISPHLNEDETGLFFRGTLFLKCDLNKGRLIFDILHDSDLDCGIIMNKVGDECAFDFIGE